MSDFFANSYWPSSYFGAAYWGGGDGGNLAATLSGFGAVAATLTSGGGSSSGSGGPYGGYSSGVRFERHQPTRRGKVKKPYRVITRGKVKIRIDYDDEEEDFEQLLGPAPEFLDLNLSAFLEFVKAKPMMQITAEIGGETVSFAADDIDEEEAIAIALALVA